MVNFFRLFQFLQTSGIHDFLFEIAETRLTVDINLPLHSAEDVNGA